MKVHYLAGYPVANGNSTFKKLSIMCLTCPHEYVRCTGSLLGHRRRYVTPYTTHRSLLYPVRNHSGHSVKYALLWVLVTLQRTHAQKRCTGRIAILRAIQPSTFRTQERVVGEAVRRKGLWGRPFFEIDEGQLTILVFRRRRRNRGITFWGGVYNLLK